MSQAITQCHRPSHSVTDRHTVSQAITQYFKPLHSVTDRHTVSQTVTQCHKPSQCHRPSYSVTSRHTVSQAVTQCHRPSHSVNDVYPSIKTYQYFAAFVISRIQASSARDNQVVANKCPFIRICTIDINSFRVKN